MSEEPIVNEQVSENMPEVETAETETANGETAEEIEDPTLEEQLEAARAEAEDYKDRWMRSQAEFANARKRMEQELHVMRRRGLEPGDATARWLGAVHDEAMARESR